MLVKTYNSSNIKQKSHVQVIEYETFNWFNTRHNWWKKSHLHYRLKMNITWLNTMASTHSTTDRISSTNDWKHLMFNWLNKTHNWSNIYYQVRLIKHVTCTTDIKHTTDRTLNTQLIEKGTCTTDWVKHTTDRKSHIYNWLNIKHNWSKK